MPKRTLEVTLPQMGESVTEGVVGSWRKHVGDQVMAGEALVEVQTDKIDAEVPAPESGLLTRILAEEGATVAIGGGLAEIELGATSNGQPPRDSDPTALAGAERQSRGTGSRPRSGRQSGAAAACPWGSGRGDISCPSRAGRIGH